MRRVPWGLAAVLVCTLSGFACQQTADTAAEEQAIRAQVAAFNAAVAAKNDSAVLALYADNAVLMPPNEPSVTGADAIRTFWAQLWPMDASLVITPTAITVAASGDMATEAGSWVFTAGPMQDTGKYLVHWHKLNGTWKMVEDMWNSDNPPPPMPADSAAGPSR